MTYGIEYLAGDEWKPDTTGDYDTEADAAAAVHLASFVFPRVQHRVVEYKKPAAKSSGRSAKAGRSMRNGSIIA